MPAIPKAGRVYSFFVITIIAVLLFVLLRVWGFTKSSVFKKHMDLFVCSAIAAVYAALIFTNLGHFHSPQTLFRGGENDTITVDFSQVRQIRMFQYMLGPSGGATAQQFTVEFSFDGDFWFPPLRFFADHAFAWDYMAFTYGGARFARITAHSAMFYMMEMAFRDENLELIPVTVISEIGAELFDEQSLVPTQPRNFKHSAIFDEVFYPRAAYEYIHRMYVNEWTHPPLGKVIISWGIRIFGMTPFGWRFMAALAGVALPVLIYFFALALFKSSFWAGFAAVVFASDFMHFVQSRTATLDVFVTLFITAMFYFMYRYSQNKSLLPLCLSGIFMGFAIATKWSGLYGALGLAVLFFIVFIKQCRQDGKVRTRTLLWCVVFFVITPAVIYVVSYIPYYNTGYLHPEYGLLAAVFQRQFEMANFHMGFAAYHPYISPWWQWLANWRPVLYFANVLPCGIRQGISTFGNPVVWWAGLLALACAIYKTAKKNFTAMFLTIAYLSLLLPWILAAREVQFIYYYYPNVVFLALMITAVMKATCENPNCGVFRGSLKNSRTVKFFGKLKLNRQALTYSFMGVSITAFLMFYPVLSGMPISAEYVRRFLLWPFMREWVLVVP